PASSAASVSEREREVKVRWVMIFGRVEGLGSGLRPGVGEGGVREEARVRQRLEERDHVGALLRRELEAADQLAAQGALAADAGVRPGADGAPASRVVIEHRR